MRVGTFFKVLESKRRMRIMVKDAARQVRLEADRRRCATAHDPLAEHPELDTFAIYASDGHSHSAASHEKAIGGKIRAIIAFIYKLRRDVEKTFDQVKSTFWEKKAWGITAECKNQQAGFIALAHNLTSMLEGTRRHPR